MCPLRRPDGADRLVLHLPRLRYEHRLQLGGRLGATFRRGAPGWGPSSFDPSNECLLHERLVQKAPRHYTRVRPVRAVPEERSEHTARGKQLEQTSLHHTPFAICRKRSDGPARCLTAFSQTHMTAPHYHSHVDSAEAVGRRLKEARLEAGLSQRQLAFPGCSAAYISRLEAGERVPSLQLLRKLAVKLEADEEYLATGVVSGPRLPAEVIEADVALRLDDLVLAAELFERVLQTTPDRRVRAEAVGGLGRLAFRKGDTRSAIDGIEEALRLAPELLVTSPSLVETLARAYADAHEIEATIGLLERAIGQMEEANEPGAATRLRILLANALIDSRSFNRAEELLGKVLGLASELLDPAQRSRVLWSQSRLHTMRGNQEGAARYARRALELLELGEDTYALARAHQALAYIEVERERPEEALALLARGSELLGTDVSPIERAKFKLEEARALAQLGRNEEAAAAALDAKSLFGDARPVDAGRAFVLVGDVFLRLGERERAREIWELALELLELEPNIYAAEAYERLGRLFEDEGRTEEALAMLKRALGTRERSNAR